jgi:hypothetical protein
MSSLSSPGRPFAIRRRRMAMAVLPLLFAFTACDSSGDAADALEGLLQFSVSYEATQTLSTDQVQPTIRIGIEGGLPESEVDRMGAVVLRWPVGARSEMLSPGFEQSGSGGYVAVLEPSPSEEGLPAGSYSFTLLGPNLHPRFDGTWELTEPGFLEPVQPQSLRMSADGVDLVWISPPQPHEWTLSVRRTDPEPAIEVGTTRSGAVESGPVELDESVEGIVWDGEASYVLELRLANDRNERVFRIAVIPPD